MKTNLHKTVKAVTLAAIVNLMLLSSCGQLNKMSKLSRPADCILQGRTSLVIYKKKPIETKYDKQFGAWEYWVTDASGQGFTIVSFTEYNEGDTMIFAKK